MSAAKTIFAVAMASLAILFLGSCGSSTKCTGVPADTGPDFKHEYFVEVKKTSGTCASAVIVDGDTSLNVMQQTNETDPKSGAVTTTMQAQYTDVKGNWMLMTGTICDADPKDPQNYNFSLAYNSDPQGTDTKRSMWTINGKFTAGSTDGGTAAATISGTILVNLFYRDTPEKNCIENGSVTSM